MTVRKNAVEQRAMFALWALDFVKKPRRVEHDRMSYSPNWVPEWRRDSQPLDTTWVTAANNSEMVHRTKEIPVFRLQSTQLEVIVDHSIHHLCGYITLCRFQVFVRKRPFLSGARQRDCNHHDRFSYGPSEVQC